MQYDISTFFDNVGRMLAYEADHPMLFSSGLFWVLFLIFLPVYALLRSRRQQMVVYVVAFSLYFYYKSSAWFFMLLIITSVLDWCLSRIMSDTRKLWKRRLCLWLSIGMSLSILGFFKYANFFLWNWNQMVEGNFQPLDIILPVGISFYTFQSISYIVDVYKGRVSPTETWIEYLFFLSYFPALVAGPIVRADYFLPQIQNRDHASRQEMAAGLWLIILGLVKKAIVADYIAQYNDLIFASPTGYSGLESLMGVVGYVVQIYCDFSGYSDMAIGISAIMGFRLTQNFNFPYKSRNLTDFWRRWHISLSTWLRDYVYIPLGGNRRGTLRTYVNNFLTMLVGGLWHGAAWKFVIWGGMHGVGLIVHKALRPWLVKIPDTWPVKAASWTLTMAYVSFLFIFFRAASFEDAWLIIRNIFGNFDIAYLAPFVRVRYVWLIFVAMIIAVHSLPTRWINAAGDWFVRAPFGAKLAVFIVAVQLVVQFMSEDVMPFIYFQF
jgi:alginate O-acetyltransferase complex protein AlgI